ncbi:MAG: hypothetical protein UDM04_05940, partial [Agathobaculum sp.]|nr:hypothetical protein [Agathobaculum sp.]
VPLRYVSGSQGKPETITPSRMNTFEAAPPRRGQWYKSPAELDFYGEFDGSALRRVPENALCAFPFRKN